MSYVNDKNNEKLLTLPTYIAHSYTLHYGGGMCARYIKRRWILSATSIYICIYIYTYIIIARQLNRELARNRKLGLLTFFLFFFLRLPIEWLRARKITIFSAFMCTYLNFAYMIATIQLTSMGDEVRSLADDGYDDDDDEAKTIVVLFFLTHHLINHLYNHIAPSFLADFHFHCLLSERRLALCKPQSNTELRRKISSLD